MTIPVEANAVSVRAGAARLLDRVDLTVATGERVAIVGPNGAGKSTLLRALSGELTPQDGSVHLKGRPVGAYAPDLLARHRAVLSQSIHVAFPFTVEEIVRMGGSDRHGPWIDGVVEAALAEVELAGARERVITTLSGGEQHRAHLARVFVQLACGENEHGPGLLLLDEPTASLDLRHQLDLVAATRRRAARGTAVIAILHDLNLAATFADRIVVLHRGAVAADGSAAAILDDGLLRRVFGVDLPVGRAPEAGMPFVLPQMMTTPETRAPRTMQ